MKFKIYQIGIILFLIYFQANLNAQNINIINIYNIQSTILLKNIQKITFSATNLTIKNTNTDVSVYNLNEIKNLNFTNLFSTSSNIKVPDNIIKYTIYPNPVVDNINIKISNIEYSTFKLDILSIEGSILLQKYFNVLTNNNIYTINVSNLKKGIYICRINSGINIITTKFIKN